jgi:hypothetical protein
MARSKKNKKNEVSEPAVEYGKELRFFDSFEEMDEYDREQMAALTPIECLEQLRCLINLAYGMHGYDPKKLPKKHSIKIIPYKPK